MRTLLAALLMLVPAVAGAQATLTPDTLTFQKARVISVSGQQETIIPGTDTPAQTQTLTAEVLGGPAAGSQITFENDYVQLSPGEVFFARHLTNELEDRDVWSVADPDRLSVLGTLAATFLALTALFGGLQGLRGLASLAGSIVLIFWVLIPTILAGYSPVLTSIGIASLIIVAGSYVTHGFTRTTSAAVIGMLLTILLTGAMASYVVDAARLTGYAAEEAVYLNFDTRGGIDMAGLLFGGIMIGLLGVLYDSAIGQAVAVEELFRASSHLTRRQVYLRALRIGREHIGALINTLAIAYTGAALPLLLLIAHSSTAGIGLTLSSEQFAAEIVRVLIGSIGLILAVPITTLIASYMLADLSGKPADGTALAHTHGH